MKIVILAAGYGTRLYPLTENVPKGLLEINGVPMIERILDKLCCLDEVDGAYIVSNDKFYHSFQMWATTYMADVDVVVVNDGSTGPDDMFGAIKDLEFIINKASLNEDILIVAGDNLFEFDVPAFCEFSRAKASACIAIKDLQDPAKAVQYGVVELAADGRIERFVEKSPTPPTALASTCFYYVPKECLGLVDKYLKAGNNPDAPGYFFQWLYTQQAVYGWCFDDTWYDIGDKNSLEEANACYAALENRENANL